MVSEYTTKIHSTQGNIMLLRIKIVFFKLNLKLKYTLPNLKKRIFLR